MNFKKIFRTLVCLVLVCALLVSVSPIRAKAFVSEYLAVTAGIVIGSVLLGLGVGMAADSTSEVLTDMVVSCQDFLTLNYDFVTDEQKIEVWSTGSLDIPYVVDQSLIEAIRTWLFDSFAINTETGEISSVVEEEVEVDVPSGFASYNGHVLPDISSKSSNYDYAVITYNPNDSGWNRYTLWVSDSPFYFKCPQPENIDQSLYIYCADYHLYYRFYPDGSYGDIWTHANAGSATGWQISPNELVWANYNVYGESSYNGSADTLLLSSSDPITSDYTTTEKKETPLYTSTGYIAAENIPLSEAYADWAAGVTTIPKEDGEEAVITGFPVGLAPTLDSTLGLSQTDVWNGVSTFDPSGGEITDPEGGNNDDRNVPFGEAATGAVIGWLLGDLTKLLFDGATSNWTFYDLFNKTWLKIDDVVATLNQLKMDLAQHVAELQATLTQNLTEILTKLSSMTETLTQTLSKCIEDLITSVFTQLEALTKTLTEAATSAAEKVKEAVESLTVPKEDYLTDKVNDLCSEFAFADSIVRTAKELKIGLAGVTTEPPVIYIDLGATRGSYDIGGMVPFIDMRWYEEFKPTADALISAFLWICFVWRMLIHLPGIISGASGIFTLSPMPSTHTAPIGAVKDSNIYVPTESYEELLRDYRMDIVDNPDWLKAFGERPSYATLKELYTIDLDDVDL